MEQQINFIQIEKDNAAHFEMDLLLPLTLERGCPRLDRRFQVAAEQVDFAHEKYIKTCIRNW